MGGRQRGSGASRGSSSGNREQPGPPALASSSAAPPGPPASETSSLGGPNGGPSSNGTHSARAAGCAPPVAGPAPRGRSDAFFFEVVPHALTARVHTVNRRQQDSFDVVLSQMRGHLARPRLPFARIVAPMKAVMVAATRTIAPSAASSRSRSSGKITFQSSWKPVRSKLIEIWLHSS